MKGLIKKVAFLLSLTTISLFAANQGTLVHGNDKSIKSEGNLEVDLDVLYAIQVNKLNDINLGTFKSGIDGDLTGKEEFCVFTNSWAYVIGYFGGHEKRRNKPFVMANVNDSNERIPYDIKMSTIDMDGNKNFLTNVQNANWIRYVEETRNRKNCQMDNLGYKPNVEIEVTVKEEDMLDAQVGTYKDTLTIITCPE